MMIAKPPARQLRTSVATVVGSLAAGLAMAGVVSWLGSLLDLDSRQGLLREAQGLASTLGAGLVATAIVAGCWLARRWTGASRPLETGVAVAGLTGVGVFVIAWLGPDRPGMGGIAVAIAAAAIAADLLVGRGER